MTKRLLVSSLFLALVTTSCASSKKHEEEKAAAHAATVEKQHYVRTTTARDIKAKDIRDRKAAESRAAALETTNEATAQDHKSNDSRAESQTKYNTQKTAQDQSNKPSDVELTRIIRRDLMKMDELSTSAKNVKIITDGGIVLLKGKVENATEKRTIAVAAQTRAGKGNVKNQIVVGNGEDVNDMKEQ